MVEYVLYEAETIASNSLADYATSYTTVRLLTRSLSRWQLSPEIGSY